MVVLAFLPSSDELDKRIHSSEKKKKQPNTFFSRLFFRQYLFSSLVSKIVEVLYSQMKERSEGSSEKGKLSKPQVHCWMQGVRLFS